MLDWLAFSPFLLFVVAVALLFDFYNGLHDAANSIATVVATRALPVWGALIMASFFNFLGAFAGTAVAAAIGKGLIEPSVVTTQVVLAALLGAIFWSVLTVILGIPISSSQSLIGGLLGAGLAAAGFGAIQTPPEGELALLGAILAQGAVAGAVAGLIVAFATRTKWLTGLLIGGAVGSAVFLVGHILGDIYLPSTVLVAVALGALLGLVVGLLRPGANKAGWILLGIFAFGFAAMALTMLAGTAGWIAHLDDGLRGLLAHVGLSPSYHVLHVKTLVLHKLTATILFIAYSPFIGFCLAFGMLTFVTWAVHHLAPGRVNRVFRYMQIGSSSFYSHGHGRNDAQKTMGVITALLVANGKLTSFDVPFEVVVACGVAIALGTLIGGHRIVKTMGGKLTHLDPTQGFASETSSAIVLTFLADKGVPVSTTHSITGSILGVGTYRRASAVSWGVARRIVTAWIITIPLAAGVAALCFWALDLVL
ncbi:MAG: inorganic phosphate transporter, PiT family [Thermoplasmata archaeon]|jgi:PiT family inorganic phosphate transporter|nr:inorganic phosphate transporter, PiT family [Thermoplasmata archaeon]